MRYIIATKTMVAANSRIDIALRRTSKSGKIFITDKDLVFITGETEDDKLAAIEGVVMTDKEALHELTKKTWK